MRVPANTDDHLVHGCGYEWAALYRLRCLYARWTAKNGDGDRSKVHELKLRLAAVRRANAAAAMKQSRHRGGQLIPEYSRVVTVDCPASLAPTAAQWITSCSLPDGFSDIPPQAF